MNYHKSLHLCQTGRVHLTKMTLSLLSKLKKVYIQLMLLIKLLRVLTAHLKAKTFLLIKCQKIMVLSLQTFLSLKVSFSSTMPYCEESLLAKLDPEGASQFLSAQPCHKEDTTLSHESADFISDLGISEDSTKDCSSGTSAAIFLRKIPMSILILFLTILLNLQLIMVICKLVNVLILKSLYL